MRVNGTEALLRHVRHEVAQTLRLFRKFFKSGTDAFLTAHRYSLLILAMFFLKLLIVFPVGIDPTFKNEVQKFRSE